MLIWQGAGILAVLIPAVLGFLAQWGVDHWFGRGFSEAHQWQNAIAWGIGAAVVWWLGTRLESSNSRVLNDPASGEIVELKSRHTLFWVPMKYWAVVWIVAAGGSCLK